MKSDTREETTMSRGFARSEELFAEAQKIIPGGVTSARHPSKFVPGAYPIFMNRGRGCHVWDVDGNEYIDWVMSFGPVVLGHCHPRVEKAVRRCLDDGFCFTMVHPSQNELAFELAATIPCAEMVKFFMSGSDATSAAIRIARIATGRDKIVRWGYHGWHDWCYGGAGSDRASVGVPNGIKQDILTFTYNDLDSLSRLFAENPGGIAGIIMQPFESSKEPPRPGFLEGVVRMAHDNGAVVIFDEIRSGFRVSLGGAQEYFKVIPDLACVSKAMANGYPISAVVGRRAVMEAAGKTRFSATFFVNAFPMVAAIETIRELKERDGVAHMWRIGTRLMDGLSAVGAELGVPLEMAGLPPIPILRFTDPDEVRRETVRKAFFSETTRRGVLLHPGHCWFLSLAHTDAEVDRTLEVARDSLKVARSVSAQGGA
jgi:glutamate-1-semialdehyde-2,1-aminomutase